MSDELTKEMTERARSTGLLQPSEFLTGGSVVRNLHRSVGFAETKRNRRQGQRLGRHHAAYPGSARAFEWEEARPPGTASPDSAPCPPLRAAVVLGEIFLRSDGVATHAVGHLAVGRAPRVFHRLPGSRRRAPPCGASGRPPVAGRRASCPCRRGHSGSGWNPYARRDVCPWTGALADANLGAWSKPPFRTRHTAPGPRGRCGPVIAGSWGPPDRVTPDMVVRARALGSRPGWRAGAGRICGGCGNMQPSSTYASCPLPAFGRLREVSD